MILDWFGNGNVMTYFNRIRQRHMYKILTTSFRTSKKTHFTITKISWLVLFRKIIVVYSKNNTILLNTLHGQSTDLLNVKVSGTYIYHCAVKTKCLFQFLSEV
jgi:hypothetical protein